MFLLYPLSVSILLPAYHANNAINVLNIGMGLSALDNTHFLRWYLLHDRGCKNHAENAINASTRNLRTGLRLTQRFGGGRWES